MIYEYSERFIMPLSHDEVVHVKGSLLAKMPGDDWQKLANLRSLLAYMFTRPGKKLLFMGTELAQEPSGTTSARLDWHLLEDPGTPACSRWCATSTTPTGPSPRCGSSTPTARASGGSRPTTPTRTCSRSPASHATASA